MSSKDKILISDLMEGFVSEVPAKPFVTFCVACNKGVIIEDMLYEKGKVFHKECFEKFGKNFPAVNSDLLSQSTNAKVELVQLKNLKIRLSGTTKSSLESRSKTKKKKRKIKKHGKNKRRSSRKKASKKRTSKKKIPRKRAKSSKRNTRRAKRRISKRKTSRR